MDAQEVHQITAENVRTELPKMTLEECLESDLDGYEYIKRKLIPMPTTSLEHGEISMNLISPSHLYFRENKLGRIYTPDTGFRVGERVLIPDIAFITNERLPVDRSKASQFRQTLQLKSYLLQTHY